MKNVCRFLKGVRERDPPNRSFVGGGVGSVGDLFFGRLFYGLRGLGFGRFALLALAFGRLGLLHGRLIDDALGGVASLTTGRRFQVADDLNRGESGDQRGEGSRCTNTRIPRAFIKCCFW